MYERPFHKNDISKNSFLVTGGAGFIGSNIIEYLLKYNAGKVYCLDNFSNGFRKNLREFEGHANFHLIEADICNYEDCREYTVGIDFVLHQAALGSVPRSINDPINTNHSNVTGFLNMLYASKENAVKKFVYAASSSTYGDSKELPKVENKIGRPLSPYAVTKLVNELYADVFYKTYNFSSIGLRYFNVFGPKQDPNGAYAAVIPLFMNAMINGNAPRINGDGEQTRDFTFVENAVQANIKALFSEVNGSEVYNVAFSERISVNKLFNSIKELSGKELDPIYGSERKGDVRDSLADITKAQKYLDYNPEVDILEGLKITWNWFKENQSFISIKE